MKQTKKDDAPLAGGAHVTRSNSSTTAKHKRPRPPTEVLVRHLEDGPPAADLLDGSDAVAVDAAYRAAFVETAATVVGTWTTRPTAGVSYAHLVARREAKRREACRRGCYVAWRASHALRLAEPRARYQAVEFARQGWATLCDERGWTDERIRELVATTWLPALRAWASRVAPLWAPPPWLDELAGVGGTDLSLEGGRG